MDLEREMAELRADSEKVERDIQDARADWERKRRDPRVPGAPAPPNDPEAAEGGPLVGDWEGEAQAAERAGQ